LEAKHTNVIVARRHSREVFERRSSAVPSGAEGKQAGREVWKRNESDARPREGFERRSSAVPSGAEGKQAGEEGWKPNESETCPREVWRFNESEAYPPRGP
jgi:hypothetical protein